MNTNYKSIKTIISSILRNPLMENITESDLATYAGDALKLIGAPMSFVDATCTIDIVNHRGRLPNDLLYVVQTMDKTKQGDWVAMRYASDTLHSKYHEVGSPDFSTRGDKEYSMNDQYIYHDDSEATVKMLYKAIKVDKDGFPMIPDNVKFERAIEAYIEWKHFRLLFQLGKLPQGVYEDSRVEYLFAVGAAQSAGQLMTIDQAESFANAYSRLLLKPLQHGKFFTNHGTKEKFKNNRI